MILLSLLSACNSSDLPQGYWSLREVGSDSLGAISIHRDEVHVDLYGSSWTTEGSVLAEVEQSKDWLWLYFPLITGQGKGTAAMRFQGGEAMLPLGARRGEFEVYFTATSSELIDFQEQQTWAKNQVQKEREYWQNNEFLISSQDSVVGTLQNDQIMLFDEHWLTPVSIFPQKKVQGADLILTFPVEPSFHGETAQIRINLPLRQISVPIANHVDPMDRHLRLTPGKLSSDDLERKVEEAKKKADRKEESFVLDQVRNIFSKHSCDELTKSNLGELPIWKGYRLEWSLLPDNECSLEIEGAPAQHRRRLHRTFTKNDI